MWPQWYKQEIIWTVHRIYCCFFISSFILQTFHHWIILPDSLLFWENMFLWRLVKRKTQSLKFVSLRLVLLHALLSREMTEPLVMLAGVRSSAQQHRLASFPPHQSHCALCQSTVHSFEQLPQFILPRTHHLTYFV